MRHAYGIDQLPENGAGQTIAIIDAFDDATIASDLIQFDQQFGLPAANFIKAEPEGAPGPAPADWEGEISLDVEWAHAIAPMATILLVESVDDLGGDLFNAAMYAANLTGSQHPDQISMRFGGGESSDEASEDSLFNMPGTTFFASAGDTASELAYPAASPYVVSVGGTNFQLDSSGNKISESAWTSGGGTSAVEA
jgi:subtilase family serine protease